MHLRVFRLTLLIVAFIMASGRLLVAQGTMPLPLGQRQEDTKSLDVREVVSKYCRLDYEGARLDDQRWTKVQPLVEWKTNPDYAEIDIIARYTVDSEPTENHGKYNVTVHYRLLGTYSLVSGYVPEPPNTSQTVQYTVLDAKGDLRIIDSENNLPHPSRAYMLKWLNEKLNAAQDDISKRRYQEALRLLQAQPASPFAK
jgi:hypothetical protein